jgi:hypothetical protein
MKNSQKILWLILVNILITYTLCNELSNIPEISSEELAEYEVKYINESDLNEKKYLEAVVKAEKFDLNKDRKISMDELKQALNFVMYPREKKLHKTIPDEVKVHIENNVDLFIKNIGKKYITIRQFAYLMRTVSLTHFINNESLKSQLDAKKEQRDEGEGEL